MNSTPTDKIPEHAETKSDQSMLKGDDQFVLKNVPHTVTKRSIEATLRSVPVEVTPAPRTGSLLSEIRSITQRGGKTNKGG